jgi:hypothetical protein
VLAGDNGRINYKIDNDFIHLSLKKPITDGNLLINDK